MILEGLNIIDKIVSLFEKIKKYFKVTDKVVEKITPILKEELHNFKDDLKDDLKTMIKDEIESYEELKRKNHLNNFIISEENGIIVKHTLIKYRGLTNASHILLLDFHNGVENFCTETPYGRFSVKIDVYSPNENYINANNPQYKDQPILSYNFLNSYEMEKNVINTFSLEQVNQMDLYLYNLVKSVKNETKSVVISSLKHNNIRWGCLLFLFDEEVETIQNKMQDITNCTSEIVHKSLFIND